MTEAETHGQQQSEESDDDVRREIERVEKDPPKKLEDWPSGRAKYRTIGGGEHEEGYGEGPTAGLGPAEVRHHDDGSVSVGGEPVDDPSEYKGEPIPGGPTDPNAPKDVGVTRSARDKD